MAGLLLGLLTSACPSGGVFQCESDDQCQSGSQAGQCTSEGYCAFESDECESGLAYGELAEPGLAGTCVPVDGGSGSTTGPTGPTGTTSTATTTTSVGSSPDGTEGPPACELGDFCEPDDPCVLVGICTDDGTCLPVDVVVCEAFGPCYEPEGQCVGGDCVFQPLPRGLPCEDGDPCTFDDFCDGNGQCSPGFSCDGPADPCHVAICTPEGCDIEPLPDGESCGPNPGDRCCGGTCVDISTDHAHCGSCFAACSENQECSSLQDTPQCNNEGPGVSGRCTCEDATMCPMGQSCSETMPYPGLCEPLDENDCPGITELGDACPGYCAYG
ncbi:MAG: hypothetical protein KDK70_02895 [Myxococcales bacterium]|nr:hypothetical protein [Myxococcales bacterium]